MPGLRFPTGLCLFSLFCSRFVLLSISPSLYILETRGSPYSDGHVPPPIPKASSAISLPVLFIGLLVKVLRAETLLCVWHNFVYRVRLCILLAHIYILKEQHSSFWLKEI